VYSRLVLELLVRNIRCLFSKSKSDQANPTDDILSRSSAGNWNNYRRHLRALLQTAIEFKVIKENPFTKVKSVAHYPNSDNIFSLMCKVANSCNFILLPFY
jgi:hypothetical protein